MKSNGISSENNSLEWFYSIGIFAIAGLIILNLPPWFSPPAWGSTIVFKLILGVLLLTTLWQWLWPPFHHVIATASDQRERGGKQSQLSGYRSFATAQDDKKEGQDDKWVGDDSPGKSAVRWILYAMGAVLGIFFLSSLFGLDPTHSFWGDPVRSWGFVNYLFYALFGLLLFRILQEDHKWIWFWAVFTGAGLLVVLIAFLQYLGAFPSLIAEQGRPGSVLGSPLYVSLFVLPFLFLTFTLGLANKDKRWKAFFFVAALVFLAGVLITTSRSAFIGLGVGILFFLWFYPKKARLLKSIALAVAVVFAGFVVMTNLIAPPAFVKSSRIMESIWNRMSIEQVLSEGRINGWEIVAKASLERPVLGYGMYNTSVAFDKHYNPTEHPYIHPSVGGSYWDSSHNLFIDVFSWAGILGLLAFLFFLGTLFWSLWRVKRNNPELALTAHGVTTAFLVYLVHAFFMFDTFATYLLFFSLVAYTCHLAATAQDGNSKSQITNYKQITNSKFLPVSINFYKFRIPVFATAILLFVAFAWQYNIKPFLVNININYATEHGKLRDCEQMNWFMEKALSQGSTFLDSYLRVQYTNQLAPCKKIHPERSLVFTKQTYKLMEEVVALRPMQTRPWIALGSSASVLANNAEMGAIADATPQHIEFFTQTAQQAFQRAQELSPYRTEVYREWAKASIATKQYEEAEKRADRCIELDPSSGICQWYGALAAIGMGDKEKGNTRIAEAETNGFKTDTIDAKHQLVAVYLGTQNYAGVKEILTELITIKPKESQYYIALLVAHIELGEYDLAQNVARLIRAQFPNRGQEAERILETIR